MVNGIAGIDHVLVGVADLEAARATWRRLGFVVTPRGRHIGWGTANYCIMFPEDYVELLGIVDPGQYLAGLDALLAARGEGVLRLALATRDAAAAQAQLAAAGLGPGEVKDLARELALPEGVALPRFQLVDLPDATVPGLPLFLCQHLTPELIRRPDWLQHPNGALRIAAMTVAVADPLALAPACERLFGKGAVVATDDTMAVHVGAAVILFCRPEELDSFHPDIALPPRPTPWIAACAFAVEHIPRAGAVLLANRVPFVEGADGALRIAPQHATGCLVEFVPAD